MLKIEIEQLCAGYLRGEIKDAELVIRTCYEHFAKTRSLKKLSDDNWVALARGKNDVRYYLNYCYSDGENYVAVYGHRMHVLKNVKYTPDAFYGKNRLREHVEAIYPDYKKVIPTDVEILGKIHEVSFINGYYNDKKYVNIGGKVFCLKQYFDEAIAGFSNEAIISLGINDFSIKIESSEKLAVIMCVAIPDGEFIASM